MSGTPRVDWAHIRWAVGFLEAFEAPDFQAGEWTPAREVDPGVFTMPCWSPSPTVERFLEGLYERGLILPFAWMHWKYGHGLAGAPERIGRANAQTCLKLLTMHVRADRFNEGHLANAFESGQLVAILRRLRVLVGDRAGNSPAKGDASS